VCPRAGLDDVQERKFLTLPGLELRRIGRPARRQSLYYVMLSWLIYIVACRAVTMQRLGKHVPAATVMHAMEVLFETVFFTWSVQRGCKEDNWGTKSIL
jgi:hypothetical protein